MKYVDTNVIIACINDNDTNHSRAPKVIDGTAEMVTSPIATLELRSVLSRTTTLTESEIGAYVDYLDEIRVKVPKINLESVFLMAEEISCKTKMKTLNVLHLSACLILRADAFVTFDKEFIEKERTIQELGLRVQFSRSTRLEYN